MGSPELILAYPVRRYVDIYSILHCALEVNVSPMVCITGMISEQQHLMRYQQKCGVILQHINITEKDEKGISFLSQINSIFIPMYTVQHCKLRKLKRKICIYFTSNVSRSVALACFFFCHSRNFIKPILMGVIYISNQSIQ